MEEIVHSKKEVMHENCLAAFKTYFRPKIEKRRKIVLGSDLTFL